MIQNVGGKSLTEQQERSFLQINVGSSDNTFTVKWNDTVKESNYNVTIEAGTLTVTAQSIDPENPDYKGITVDAPTDVEYTGADQTWLPTVTDGNGKALVKDTDYTVTYDNEDRTNTAYIVSSNRCICCQKSESEKAAERSGRAAG